jgi:hypothetical protein
MRDVRINRWLDLLDRVGWTFMQAYVGSAVVLGLDDWRQSLGIAGGAAIVAAGKVLVAQNTGSINLGAAVPGQVLEPAPAPVNPAVVR